MVTKTETVEIPVEVIRELPASLTDPIPYPQGLPDGFTVDHLIYQVLDLYDLLDKANMDREAAERVTRSSDEG